MVGSLPMLRVQLSSVGAVVGRSLGVAIFDASLLAGLLLWHVVTECLFILLGCIEEEAKDTPGP